MDHTMMAAQAMGHAPFFYYAPEHNLDARQHGLYTHQPGFQQHVALYPMAPTLPSTPVYSRPASACSQPAAPTLYSNGPAAVTPMASPQPAAHKPTITLETEISESENYPSTPPLSTSGSVISSPNSCDILQTPMNPMFSGLEGLEGVKGQFEPAETLVLDWASCGSPPVTPVYLQSQPGTAASLNTSDLLSTASCPSLSPSPAPYARSVASEEDVSFCDPRKLTVGVPATANPTLAPEYSALATLGEDEQLRGDAFAKVHAASAAQPTFDFSPAVTHGLPAFDDLSDLESDDDFSNLVNVGDHTAADVRRPRACTGSSVVSLGHGSFIGEDDLGFDEAESFPAAYLPSPSCSAEDGDCHQDKRIKSNKGTPTAPAMTKTATDAQSGNTEQKTSSQAVANESKSSSGSEAAPTTPLPAPVNRRGRKQSLTEDPSKTFVCDLCNRRFRRQEHLKRHYRSLHTQEKPFECNECGKKFSRSDNLAQHARTHGSGAIVMDLIDNAELHGVSMAYEDYHNLGKVLFQVASEVPGSASESSSEEGVSDHGKKKRKRTD